MANAAPSPQLDLAPPKKWRRFIPAWLRSLFWVDSAPRYDAFLSYSWQADLNVAPAIQSALQRFLCPWYKPRAKTIFRDLSCLPAGSSLEKELFDRIDRSKHFIVLASPNAAKAGGMEMEARYWFSRPRDGEVLIIVTEGDCKTWDEIQDRLLPASVRTNLASTPLWVPLQHRRSEILTNPDKQKIQGDLVEDLKQILLRLYAPLSWGELQGEERAQRRRALGLMALAAGLLLLFAVAALRSAIVAHQRQLAAEAAVFRERIALEAETSARLAETQARKEADANADEATRQTGVAVKNENEAKRQQSIAEEETAAAQRNARESKARELAAYAVESLNEDPERSILLGMQAVNATLRYGQPAVPAAEETLRQAILSSQVRMTLRGHGNLVWSVAWSPDGKRLATASMTDGEGVGRGQRQGTADPDAATASSVTSVAWSPDGKRLATASR